jgi:hypothetical protein
MIPPKCLAVKTPRQTLIYGNDMENSLHQILDEARAYQTLEKALPPKLAYRLRSWLRRYHQPVRPQLAQLVSDRAQQDSWARGLHKSQVGVTLHDNGSFRFDFPKDLPQGIRDLALRWAKKRGLNPIEASLAKSDGAASHAVFVNAATAPVRQRLIIEF